MQPPQSSRPITLPPPPPELSSRGSLTWHNTPVPNRPLPQHPLLLLAEPPPPSASHGGGLTRLLPAWRWPVRGRFRGGASNLPAILGAGGRRSEFSLSASQFPGPLVVLVLGGKGGVGRSSISIDLAYAFGRGREGRRVLLVDADAADPDLDLRLGASRSGHDLAPLARLDQLVLRLAAVQDGSRNLDGCLFTTADLGFLCLFAPANERQAASVGREHLDYLFDHLLQPTFQVIVVDAGRCLGLDSLAIRFWLERASAVLLPTASGESHQRNCIRTMRYVEQNSALRRGDCLAVTNAACDLRELRLQLSQQGLEVMSLPWIPKAAHQAEARQVPLAHIDQRMLSASLALADQLSRIGARSSFNGR